MLRTLKTFLKGYTMKCPFAIMPLKELVDTTCDDLTVKHKNVYLGLVFKWNKNCWPPAATRDESSNKWVHPSKADFVETSAYITIKVERLKTPQEIL